GPGFDANGMCKDPEGQLWDPYTGVYDASKSGPVRSGHIPFNNLTTYQSPGSPKLAGTPYQPPAGPGNLIDPVALKMMQYYPQPNINVGTSAYNRFANYFASYSTPSKWNKYGIKIDHYFREQDRLSARFSWRTLHSDTVNVYGNPLDPHCLGLTRFNAYNGVVNYTHVFNPKTLLNISLGYVVNPVKDGQGILDTSYPKFDIRSEEHTSELQSRFDLVCRLLLEKKQMCTFITCL